MATKKGDRHKLGTISYATIKISNHNLIVVNGYTQFHWLGKGVVVDYDALGSVFKAV